MTTIKQLPGKGHVIMIEAQGNAGNYASLLRDMVTALENTPCPEARKNIGTLLKAMLPDEYQLNFTQNE